MTTLTALGAKNAITTINILRLLNPGVSNPYTANSSSSSLLQSAAGASSSGSVTLAQGFSALSDLASTLGQMQSLAQSALSGKSATPAATLQTKYNTLLTQANTLMAGMNVSGTNLLSTVPTRLAAGTSSQNGNGQSNGSALSVAGTVYGNAASLGLSQATAWTAKTAGTAKAAMQSSLNGATAALNIVKAAIRNFASAQGASGAVTSYNNVALLTNQFADQTSAQFDLANASPVSPLLSPAQKALVALLG